jgi:hypothetical protein
MLCINNRKIKVLNYNNNNIIINNNNIDYLLNNLFTISQITIDDIVCIYNDNLIIYKKYNIYANIISNKYQNILFINNIYNIIFDIIKSLYNRSFSNNNEIFIDIKLNNDILINFYNFLNKSIIGINNLLILYSLYDIIKISLDNIILNINEIKIFINGILNKNIII